MTKLYITIKCSLSAVYFISKYVNRKSHKNALYRCSKPSNHAPVNYSFLSLSLSLIAVISNAQIFFSPCSTLTRARTYKDKFRCAILFFCVKKKSRFSPSFLPGTEKCAAGDRDRKSCAVSGFWKEKRRENRVQCYEVKCFEGCFFSYAILER